MPDWSSWSLPRRGRLTRWRVWAGLAIVLVLSAGLATALLVRTRQPAPSAATPTSAPAPADVAFVTADSGWLSVEGSGATTVLRTTDGGRHWHKSLSFPGDVPAQLRFFDARAGFVFVSDPRTRQDTLYRTEDGGFHWDQAALPAPPTANSGGGRLSFADGLHGWYLQPAFNSQTSQDFTLYRTTDGGRTWPALLTVDIAHPMSHGLSNAGLKTGLAFHDPQNGWIGQITPAQAVVWVTHDGGVDWEQATLPAPAGGWGPSVEVDAGAAMPFAGSPDAVEAVATTRPTSSIRHSYTSVSGDLGRSWSAPSPLPELPAGQSSPRIAAPVAFAGPTHWWYPLGPALYETQDAGRQWRRGGTLPGGRQFARLGAAGPSSLWSIAGRPARCEGGGNCLASWTEIALLRTADGGRHWTAVPVGEGAR